VDIYTYTTLCIVRFIRQEIKASGAGIRSQKDKRGGVNKSSNAFSAFRAPHGLKIRFIFVAAALACRVQYRDYGWPEAHITLILLSACI
jgi:hypothetical protein